MARNENIHMYNIETVYDEFDRYLTDSNFNEFIDLIIENNLNDRYLDLVKEFQDKYSIDEHTETAYDFASIVQERMFNEFLRENKISTVYAKELLDGYIGNDYSSIGVNIEEFKTRRHKPKTRFLVKKILVPLAVTLGVAAGTVAAVSLAGLTAGSSIGFIPVFTSLSKTAVAVTSVGLTAGVVATPIVIGIKNKIVKAHYSHKYETADENLKRLYLGQTELNDLPINHLMNKINDTNHKIADSRNPISKFFMRMKNKNRIKHLTKTTKDLMAMYNLIENTDELSVDQKVGKLNCLHDILEHVDRFIQHDVSESKHRAILTAKRSKKGKIKPMVFDNVDLYADLQISLKRNSVDVPESEKPKKHSKFTINYLRDQHIESRNIITGCGTFIQRLISKWRVENVVRRDARNNPILDEAGNIIMNPTIVKDN